MVHILGQETFETKIKKFEDWQKKLVEMANELANEEKNFDVWVRETREFKELQTKQRKAQQEAELYKAELKSWAGITDGEKSNILDLLKAVKKVSQA